MFCNAYWQCSVTLDFGSSDYPVPHQAYLSIFADRIIQSLITFICLYSLFGLSSPSPRLSVYIRWPDYSVTHHAYLSIFSDRIIQSYTTIICLYSLTGLSSPSPRLSVYIRLPDYPVLHKAYLCICWSDYPVPHHAYLSIFAVRIIQALTTLICLYSLFGFSRPSPQNFD
jgi:hypothetical protein